MIACPDPVAVFRAATGTTHVYVRPDGAGAYTVDCDGCGLYLGPDALPQVRDDDPESYQERLLARVEGFAEGHAAGCHKLPRDQWPSIQNLTSRR